MGISCLSLWHYDIRELAWQHILNLGIDDGLGMTSLLPGPTCWVSAPYWWSPTSSWRTQAKSGARRPTTGQWGWRGQNWGSQSTVGQRGRGGLRASSLSRVFMARESWPQPQPLWPGVDQSDLRVTEREEELKVSLGQKTTVPCPLGGGKEDLLISWLRDDKLVNQHPVLGDGSLLIKAERKPLIGRDHPSYWALIGWKLRVTSLALKCQRDTAQGTHDMVASMQDTNIPTNKRAVSWCLSTNESAPLCCQAILPSDLGEYQCEAEYLREGAGSEKIR